MQDLETPLTNFVENTRELRFHTNLNQKVEWTLKSGKRCKCHGSKEVKPLSKHVRGHEFEPHHQLKSAGLGQALFKKQNSGKL